MHAPSRCLLPHLQELVYKPTPADAYRVFVCDTEHSTHYQGAQARLVDLCVVDVATGVCVVPGVRVCICVCARTCVCACAMCVHTCVYVCVCCVSI